MIGLILDSGENEAGELQCSLMGVIIIERVHIITSLVGGSDTDNFEINVFEIELIINCIF